MASSSLSSRLFANVLKGIEHEKAERLKKEWEAQRASFDAQESQQRADAALLIKKRADFTEREKRQRDELTELEQKVRDAQVRGEEERRIDTAMARAAVFRGSSASDVKERLVHEGVPEALAQEIVRLRTLDQTLENRGGMSARFIEKEDPTRSRAEPHYRSLDESVGSSGKKRYGPEQQYLRMEEQDSMYQGVPDAVSGLAKPPGTYDHGIDKEEGVRKGLGLGEHNPVYR